MPTLIHWFRQDLRLADNPALSHAARQGSVVPVFIWDESLPWMPGGASRWWLHHSLVALDADLRKRGSALVVRQGKAADVLAQLMKEVQADKVVWNRCYEPAAIARDSEIKTRLPAESFNGSLLVEPWEVKTGSGSFYKVFTPYWKACLNFLATLQPPTPFPAPTRLQGPKVASDSIAGLGLLPTQPDWAGGLRATWTPGEQGAHQQLDAFLDTGIRGYKELRNRPDMAHTSKLSPHLHFGEISPRQIWHAVHGKKPEADVACFLSEIGWREFSHNLLHYIPTLPEAPLRAEFARFPWRDDAEALCRWQRGQTGYPIVDAGMRQLWHTGWMHNRVRMIAASFLVKDLFIPWQQGAAWFWDTLVDADLANNSASWQWVAGCGADAAPYFRIFNPTEQGKKFDPNGDYIRTWVPELAHIPGVHIHTPLEVPGYSAPMVNHAQARTEALAAYKNLKP